MEAFSISSTNRSPGDYKFYKDGALDSNVMRQYSTEG